MECFFPRHNTRYNHISRLNLWLAISPLVFISRPLELHLRSCHFWYKGFQPKQMNVWRTGNYDGGSHWQAQVQKGLMFISPLNVFTFCVSLCDVWYIFKFWWNKHRTLSLVFSKSGVYDLLFTVWWHVWLKAVYSTTSMNVKSNFNLENIICLIETAGLESTCFQFLLSNLSAICIIRALIPIIWLRDSHFPNIIDHQLDWKLVVSKPFSCTVLALLLKRLLLYAAQWKTECSAMFNA